MPQIFNYSGDDDFYHGASIYSNPNEAGLLCSLGNHVDVYFPRKRARVNALVFVSPTVFDQKKEVSIDVLPDECLYEIFRRLPGDQERSSCASVSKRWLMLLSTIPKKEIFPQASEIESDDGFLTRSLEGKKATDVRLASLAVGTSGHGGLGKLMIRGTNSICGVTNLGLRAVARCCPSLKVLSLWNVSTIGDESLFEIANGCHRLEKLDLRQCPSISDKGLLAIAKSCPYLTTITIDGCLNVGNEGLQSIGEFCQNVKSITIKDCPLVSDQGIASLISSSTYVLSKLKLHGLNVSDVSLAVIGHYGKALTELALNNLQNLNERGFWVMGNSHGLQHLKSLTLTSCRGITDIVIEALAKGCPNLNKIVLKKCAFLSDNGLVSFAKAARSLESLQLEECHRITQIGCFGLLLNCGPQLKALTMSSCFGYKDVNLGFPLPKSSTPLQSITVQNCPGLGDMTLAMLAEMCPRLQHLDLAGLPGITDAGVLSLIKSSDAGEGLVKASFTGCLEITDNAIVPLAKFHGGILECLNLDGCGKITDASLAAIADECLVLNELDVSKCAITDLGVASLARSKHLGLQILSLSGCSVLSDKCLSYLMKMGQSLMGLNLQHCNSISSSVIDMLTERLFRCDILA